jgi:hypothetical protein
MRICILVVDGKIAEIIICAGALGTSDRSKTFDYLGARYGIAIGA